MDLNNGQKTIGSDYHISNADVGNASKYDCRITPIIYSEGENYFSTCRSTIEWVLCNEVKTTSKMVLAPGFTCHSVIEPCIKSGFDVYPYPVNSDLTIDWTELVNLIESINPGVIIFHSYFGFNTIKGLNDIYEKLHEKNICVIEDRTQCLFSEFKNKADYVVGSIRKWLPVPDGAFVYGLKNIPELECDEKLCESKLAALNSKALFVEQGIGESKIFRELFIRAEEILDNQEKPFSMHEISKSILKASDLEYLKTSRRINYEILSKRIAKHQELQLIIPDIGVKDVPFHLPVLVHCDRSAFQSYLASNGVFATVIWSCSKEFCGLINRGADELYRNILCFHCDQRYNESDMNRIGDLIDNYFICK